MLHNQVYLVTSVIVFCVAYDKSVLLSLRKVLVFEDPPGPIYKSLSLSSIYKVLRTSHSANILLCMHTRSP